MRNQGRCGSCWAFASASAAMADLCISHQGNGAFASSSDRYEASVAQMMSCNRMQYGCKGGTAGGARDALKKGITKERDSVYACGGGDPSKHFDVPSTACKSPPWGQTCDKTNRPMANWNFGGGQYVRGEANMRDWVGRGHSMYFRFDTYRNIFSYRGAAAANSVYKSWAGTSKTGGHAVTLIGYGRLGSDDYWLIQNSWGSSWGFGGYGRYKRGTNFGNCERVAYGFNAWVTGGTCPGSGLQKCTGDGSTWGIRNGAKTTGGGTPTRAPPTRAPPTKAPPTRAPPTRAPPTTTKAASRCIWSEHKTGKFLGAWSKYCAKDITLGEAKAACDAETKCAGVTFQGRHYLLRSRPFQGFYPSTQNSWVCN